MVLEKCHSLLDAPKNPREQNWLEAGRYRIYLIFTGVLWWQKWQTPPLNIVDFHEKGPPLKLASSDQLSRLLLGQ